MRSLNSTSTFSSLLVGPFLYLLLTLTHLSQATSPECSCYLTSSSSSSGPNFFTHNQFFDFRSIAPSLLPSSIPTLITLPSQDADATTDVTSDFFRIPAWVDHWVLQNFSAADKGTGGMYEQIASSGNLWVGRNCDGGGEEAMCLVMRSIREEKGWQSVVEMDGVEGALWKGSFRVRLRVVPNGEFEGSEEGVEEIGGGERSGNEVDPGAVLGFFTYGSDTSESDMEILTRDPTGMIRCSNQPDYDESTGESVPGASTQVTLPERKEWTQWIDYRLDWLEGVSRWWVNGEVVLNKTINVPKTPGGLILNLWGDGGEWSGEMRVGGDVRVEVAWIEMVYNVSRSEDGGEMLRKREEQEKCQVGCWVDGGEVKEIGVPVVAFDSTSLAMRWSEGLLTDGGMGFLAGQAVALLIVYVLFDY